MSSNDPLNQITALSCPSRENQARGKQSKPRGAPTGAKSNLAPIFLCLIPKMNRLKPFLLLLIIISSCQSRNEFADISNQIDFAYKQLKYSDKVSEENLEGIKYYSKDSLLIETVGFEYRTKLIYDDNNNLIETNGFRSQRKLLFYDKNNNFIGTYYTSDSIVDRDTIKFKQTRFYNSKNQLTREHIHSGNNLVNGEYFEIWKKYEYLENQIIKEIETYNTDTIWIGKYTYDKNNNLLEISRRLADKYEIEIFSFNELNKIKTRTIVSNEHKIDKHTSYSVNNNRTEYLYYENGLIKEETRFNHLGEEVWKNIYEYEPKKY
ncbi:hypothetical protein [Flagellimonas sp. S3867]|uniref:hypothetical protein n=1 Tax=Flagellimonas sp. S3867 TaxID=2768063 RepID=UPI0016825F76|nr:hypothetical protein [Flagellimonas sp. S3867]